MLKIVTIINWIVIGLLGLLVAAETLFPAKGGDAAGRGMGQAFYYLAIIAFFVLLGLNLLPFPWAKYTGLGLILLPIFLIKFDSMYVGLKKWMARTPEGFNQDGTPWFRDAQKQRLALAIYNGDVDQVKKLLQTPIPELNAGESDGTTMLQFAVNETAYTSYKPEAKLECVKLLFDAGAKFDTTNRQENPIHLGAATTGSAQLLKLLLEHGADPNARDVYFHKPVLFEAISSYKEPGESVQILLDFGADPNATAAEGDDPPMSALLFAARAGRWKVCRLLIERGADVRFTTTDGNSLRTYIEPDDPYFRGDGYSTRADFDAVKKAIQ